jgi:hypothetical protein
MGGIYEVAAEMGLNAKICLPSFIKIVSGIQKLTTEGIHIHTDSMEIA